LCGFAEPHFAVAGLCCAKPFYATAKRQLPVTIAASPEFLELERLRQRAREDEANALSTARKQERMIWQAENERLRAEVAELRAKING